MPKLPKQSFTLISGLLILALFLVVGYYLYSQSSGSKSPKLEKEDSYTLFNGEVVALFPEDNQISVKSGTDGKLYLVTVSGEVLLNSDASSFAEIKLGDQVNAYSSEYKQDQKKEFPAEKVIIVRLTPEVLDKISN